MALFALAAMVGSGCSLQASASREPFSRVPSRWERRLPRRLPGRKNAVKSPEMVDAARRGYGGSAMASVPALDREQELNTMFRQHYPLLERLCVRWTGGHRADAQDLLSEAYLRAVGATRRCRILPDNLISWLSTIIANLARDYLRVQRRHTRLRDDDDAFAALCDPRGASDTTLVTRERLARTLEEVRYLNPLQRRAVLARSEGEDYEVIAAQLGTSPANARKLVQTARKVLRARWE